MALEIIKRFFAIEAAVHGLAGGGRKLADEFCMMRIAMRALHGFFAKHIRRAELLLRIRRRNAEGFQLLLAFFGHPIGGPGGRELLLNGDVAVAFFD